MEFSFISFTWLTDVAHRELRQLPAKKALRRRWLTYCGGNSSPCKPLKSKDYMNIGIIGAGHIGSALAARIVSLGHSVYIANSRGPETLKDVAQKTGAKPVTAQEAARHGEIIVVTIPLKNIPDLPKDLFAGVAADVPVIDTSNYYPMLRDGHILELETGDLTESEWVQKHLDRPVVKVFNNIYADHLQNKGLPAGTPGRISLPVAGDDAAAKQKVMALVQELGFDAVDDGSLHES